MRPYPRGRPLVATWTLTVRAGPKVERRRFDTLEHALAALEARVAEITEHAERHPADTKLRRYGPEQQVVARFELSGPQRRLSTVHAGIDVRGDGSSEPYLGRVRRQPIHGGHGEDAAATIRAALLDR